MKTPPDSTLADAQGIIADLRRQLTERTAERDEAVAQQTATAEVLQVINSCPGDLAPVFDAMLEKALRLCTAAFGALFTFDGTRFPLVSSRGFPPALLEYYREPIEPPSTGGSAMGRLVRGGSTSQVTDIRADAFQSPLRWALADLGGARTMIWVALRRKEALLGCIAIYRQEVRPFSEKEIALLENFAAQAVIAMENARLMTETREALEQQTATAEVLQVINSSPGDLTPVFDAMLERALASCGGTFGALLTFDGERFHPVASHGHAEFDAWHRAHGSIRPVLGSQIARIIGGEDAVQITDIANDEVYREGSPPRRAMVDIGGFQTLLCVALRRDNTLLGVLQMYRQEVRPFSDKQIALLQNFAAQAVIAMENARLLGELRHRTRDLQESLEYQTATSDVLKVISQSDADLTYVLQTALDTAARLCAAGWGHIFLRRGERLQRMASFGVTAENRADMDANPVAVDAHSASGRAVLTGEVLQIADIAADPEYAHSATRALRHQNDAWGPAAARQRSDRVDVTRP
jgi:GAF domain-containing protein